jgi:lipopolysaccharide transport system ATP-binding protein
MTDIAIRTEGLSKRYRLGAKHRPYKTLRDTLTSMASAPLRYFSRQPDRGPARSTRPEYIWAVKDVSFEVKRGDIVGIIGRNGAGKSTLLKILSRITEPTAGSADLRGRIGSLLEVGTGFHPELTGRENIFLNGAILGMKKAELDRKFDEIVSFAEVETFIDTPVKYYSSGMFLRLAFAVAAHLEPKILLVDEVLAVGDALFQKKCLGKMGEVAKEGRTVLFVSHNMGAIRSLCNRGIVLNDGGVLHNGDVSKSIEEYYRSIGILKIDNAESASSGNGFRSGFDTISLNGSQGNTVLQSEGFEVSTVLKIDRKVSGFTLFCVLEFLDGANLAIVRKESSELECTDFESGRYQVTVKFPPLWLNPSLYSVHFKAFMWGNHSDAKHISDKFPLDVQGVSSLTQGVLQPEVDWKINKSQLVTA